MDHGSTYVHQNMQGPLLLDKKVKGFGGKNVLWNITVQDLFRSPALFMTFAVSANIISW